MTVASEITKAQTNLANSYTACQNKGATLPTAQNFDNLPATIDTITGGGSTGKYQLLQRIKDDSNNEIGTVSGFFTDSNDVEYAVVCLDAYYRLLDGQWCSNNSTAVTDLPLYSAVPTAFWYNDVNTATKNTNLILAYCTSGGYTSTACTHCRSKSFIIGGVTYYGQLPNAKELFDIATIADTLNTLDPTFSNSKGLFTGTVNIHYTSTQVSATNAWYIHRYGDVARASKRTNSNTRIIPILELPNAV